MNAYQRRWLFLVCTGLLALSGASCPKMFTYTEPLPRVLPARPPIEQVIEVVNRNTRKSGRSRPTGRR